ncbi:MAG: hypothetical protein V2B18_09870 [Pseudomonadota bacterium]
MARNSRKPSLTGYEGITRLSGRRSLAGLKHYHTIPGFRLGGEYCIGQATDYEFGGKGGITTESIGAGPLRTACITAGTPQRDSRGRIVNAVAISPYYSGDSAWCYHYWHDGRAGNDFSLGPVVGPGKLIDTDRFFVVFLDAVGLWGASKPSDGPGLRFPRYSIFDCVQANYRLLVDYLNVSRVRLATGVSMGAMQTYAWAVLHPGFVEAIMPIGGSTSIRRDPVVRWVFELMTAAMMSDPVWRDSGGDYYHLPKAQHPGRGMMFGWSILMHNGLDLDYRVRQGWGEVVKEVFSWEPTGDKGALLREKARDYDVNDLIMRNRAQESYDVHDYLPGLSLPTLVIHVANDLWLRPSLAEEAAGRIPGARYLTFDSELAHFAVFRAPNVLKTEVAAFLRDIGM